jgi:hypothetical protein
MACANSPQSSGFGPYRVLESSLILFVRGGCLGACVGVCLAFGVPRASHPRLGDFHQHLAIFFGGALRQSPAFGGIVAKFFGVLPGIPVVIFHLWSALLFPLLHIGNQWNLGKFPFKFLRLVEPNPALRSSRPVVLGLGKGAMGKAEQYRHYAAECIRLAQQSQLPPEKSMLLSMAASWRRLAEHAEDTGKRNGGEEPK